MADKRTIKNAEKKEIKRLEAVYDGLPSNKKSVAEGLIVEASRLKVRLDYLWKDLQDNGETEWFTQSEKTPPYERERPQARLFTSTDKAYQSVIRQLDDLLSSVSETKVSKLEEMMNEDE